MNDSPNGYSLPYNTITSLTHIQVLQVIFDIILAPEDLYAFRGALSERVGHEHDWFHNHNNDDSEHQFHYRYPLIQYKLRGNQPMLVCIAQGVQAARMFFEQQDWSLTMKGMYRPMEIDELRLKKYPVEVKDLEEGLPYSYRLKYWQALNQDNYRRYNELEGLREIVDFLEPLLANHLISFAKGISWQIPGRFEVQITEMYPTRFPRFKEIHTLAFNFNFDTNLLLPDYIGLGKGASLGYGTITRIKRKRYS